MGRDNYHSNSRGERIDPATEDKQRDVELLLQKLTEKHSLILNSDGGGSETLAIASNLAHWFNQECRTCLLTVPSGNTGRIYLTLADRDATVSDFLLPEDQIIPMPVTNLNKLHFYGGTDGDVVHILWRN